MQTRKRLKMFLILLIVVINVGCDQITKQIVREEVAYNEQIPIIHQRLTLTKIENSGAFLSLGDSLPASLKFVLLSLFPTIALVLGLLYLLFLTSPSFTRIFAIASIIGGGTGNMYDRVKFGSVTDFLHLDLIIFQTGIFNMADVSIMIGTIALLVEAYLSKSQPDWQG